MMCNEWFQKLPDQSSSPNPNKSTTTKDAVIQSICRLKENVKLPECKSINRRLDTIYNAISGEKWGNDSCWYKPCKNASNYHVTSDLKNQECNANICQQIVDVVDVKGNVDVSKFENSIDCKFDRKPQNENDKNEDKDDEDKDNKDDEDNRPLPTPPTPPEPKKEEKKEDASTKGDQTILEKIKNNKPLLISLIVVAVIILIVWIYFIYRMFKK
jgi:hypothetical protein